MFLFHRAYILYLLDQSHFNSSICLSNTLLLLISQHCQKKALDVPRTDRAVQADRAGGLLCDQHGIDKLHVQTLSEEGNRTLEEEKTEPSEPVEEKRTQNSLSGTTVRYVYVSVCVIMFRTAVKLSNFSNVRVTVYKQHQIAWQKSYILANSLSCEESCNRPLRSVCTWNMPRATVECPKKANLSSLAKLDPLEDASC